MNPIWDPRPDFCYCQVVAVLFLRNGLSDERTSLLFVMVIAVYDISIYNLTCRHST
jgi:hypothetical protein